MTRKSSLPRQNRRHQILAKSKVPAQRKKVQVRRPQSKAKKVHRKIKPNVIAVCCRDKAGKFGWLRYKCALPSSISSSQSMEFPQLNSMIVIVSKFEDATKFIQMSGAQVMAEKAQEQLGIKTKIFKQLSMNIARMKSMIGAS